MRPVQVSPSPLVDEGDTPALSPVSLIKSEKYSQSRKSSGSLGQNNSAEKMTFDSTKDRTTSREIRNFGELEKPTSIW